MLALALVAVPVSVSARAHFTALNETAARQLDVLSPTLLRLQKDCHVPRI
jgi:hypothetical protein